jgi:triosephosphate isomerase
MIKNQIKNIKGHKMKFIIGNWKSNGTISEKDAMFNSLKNVRTNNKIVLCLPFTLLDSNITHAHLGAQDISVHSNGAFTGDISGQMLKDAGVECVLVGHSERRLYHNETNEIVKKKAKIALDNKIVPIICIGETLEEKKTGRTMTAVKKMLLDNIPDKYSDYIIAYEPRWAIGTGLTPTMDEITAVHETIFKALRGIGHEDTPILYGGSVNANNAQQIASLPHVDGLLVGGASLKSETFLPIINTVK